MGFAAQVFRRPGHVEPRGGAGAAGGSPRGRLPSSFLPRVAPCSGRPRSPLSSECHSAPSPRLGTGRCALSRRQPAAGLVRRSHPGGGRALSSGKSRRPGRTGRPAAPRVHRREATAAESLRLPLNSEGSFPAPGTSPAPLGTHTPPWPGPGAGLLVSRVVSWFVPSTSCYRFRCVCNYHGSSSRLLSDPGFP